MKRCNGCQETKPTSEFGKHSAQSDGLQSQCRECRRAYQRQWYKGASDIQKSRVKASSRKNTLAARQFVFDYLLTHPCVDCGEDDPVVLEFDHRERSSKLTGIAEMFHSWIILKELEAEIAKCDVRCSNCHKRRTAQQFGWWKVNLGKANGQPPVS